MDQRLLAYLSLAFYSISNQLINGNQNDAARHFVELYKLADPSNSEAWYFSAVLHARTGDGHGAGADLVKAVGYGFNDEARLRQQQEFQGLSGQIGLSAIESKMRLNK
jgi:Flp pilus assembly protein TadD